MICFVYLGGTLRLADGSRWVLDWEDDSNSLGVTAELGRHVASGLDVNVDKGGKEKSLM